MFPTLSALIAIFYRHRYTAAIPNFWVFCGAGFYGWLLGFLAGDEAKEALGYVHSFKRTITVGKAPTVTEIAGNGIFGFIIGYKLVDGVLNYHALIDDTQGFILSSRGNWFGGIICRHFCLLVILRS
jgi:phosphatidylglycerol:prolipoprotein diacylglycerol transferase